MLAIRSRECRRRSSVLPLNLSDTASTSQDGSSLEFIAAIAGRQCYIKDASGRGLWQGWWGIHIIFPVLFFIFFS